MDRLLLTPKEATELLGISRSKLYELLRDGTIESVKIGDCRRYRERPWTSTSSVYGEKPWRESPSGPAATGGSIHGQ